MAQTITVRNAPVQKVTVKNPTPQRIDIENAVKIEITDIPSNYGLITWDGTCLTVS